MTQGPLAWSTDSSDEFNEITNSESKLKFSLSDSDEPGEEEYKVEDLELGIRHGPYTVSAASSFKTTT
jgi:anti-sigma28 factor (negative regulator of flagellin synthesis)